MILLLPFVTSVPSVATPPPTLGAVVRHPGVIQGDGAASVDGNASASEAHHREGDAVPARDPQIGDPEILHIRKVACREDGDPAVVAAMIGVGEPAGRWPCRVRLLLISMLPPHVFWIKSVSPALAALIADDREV